MTLRSAWKRWGFVAAFLCALVNGPACAAPAVTIQFSPAAIAQGGTTTFMMTIYDDANAAFNNGSLVMAYPAGLVNGSPAVTYDSGCGTTVASPGVNGFSISNITLTTFQVCYLYVTVTSNIPGTYTAQFPAGGLSTSTGSNASSVSAVLNVVAPTVVTNTNDGGPGSLRQAILDTNASCTGSGADSIAFNIVGAGGPYTIQPLSQLPSLGCGSLVLDGYTQSGASRNTDTAGSNNANIQVALDGSQCIACDGLAVNASYVTISGLAMYNWGGSALQLNAATYVHGNYIGTDPGGMTAHANGSGVTASIGYGYVGSTLAGDRNLITGNTGAGIMVQAGAGVSVVNNQVGGRRDGTAGVGNGGAGIFFNAANYSRSYVEYNFVRYNGGAGVVVAGPLPVSDVIFTLNAMSGNGGIGIDLDNDGATANDETGPPYDTDTGPNHLTNYPVVTSSSFDGTDTTVQGYIKSSANASVTVQLFDNSSATNYQGEIPLTTSVVALDANGYGTFSIPLRAYHASYVSAAATIDTCGDGCITSSEYSAAVATTTAPSCYIQVSTPVTGDFPAIVTGSGTVVVAPSTAATLNANCFNPNNATVWSWSTSEASPGINVTTPAAGLTATYSVNMVTPGGAATVTVVLQASPAGAPVCSITPTTPMPLSPTSSGTFNITSSCSPSATGYVWGGTTVLSGQGTASASMQVSVPGNAGYGFTAQMTPSNTSGTGPDATRIIWISPAEPTPASLSFPTTNVGAQSGVQTVTVQNYSNYFTPYLAVAASSQFVVTANNCPSPVPVQGSCTISVAFAPTAAGAQTGTLTVSFPFAGTTTSYAIALSGTAVGAPGASTTPTSLAFAARTVSTTSLPQTVTLGNTGSLALTISAITISGDFAFTSGCPSSLAPGATCTIDVTFTPLVVGARTGTLTINDNAAGSPHTVALSGSGLSASTPVADLVPSTLVFPPQPVGTDSAVQSITVDNTGNAPLAFNSITVTGDFSIAALGPGASPPQCPVTLLPGTSCQIGVVFHPSAVNLREGTLTVNSNGAPVSAHLAGTGLVLAPPQLSMPASLSFDGQPVGTRSAGKPIAIANTSPYVASLTELAASGDFSVSDSCATIAPGAVCSPLVTFMPTALGVRSGTLTVRTLRDPEPYVVNLSGTGEANDQPELELSASHLGFGNALVGMPLTSQVSIKNVGLAPLVVSALTVSGDYFTDTGCITSIAPGATCTVHVTFMPATVGGRIGTLQVQSNAPGSPHSVDLTGTGCYVPSASRARFGVLLCGS